MDWTAFLGWWRARLGPRVRRIARQQRRRARTTAWRYARPQLEQLEPRQLITGVTAADAPQPALQSVVVDFTTVAVQSYGGNAQDVSKTASITNGGQTLTLTGNTWKKIALNYTVTAETILEFDFTSSKQGEVQGVGFDTDDTLSPETFFKVSGTQTWGITNYATYVTGSGTTHYKITVGQFFTGGFSYLTFGNDHDVSKPDSFGSFSNVMLYEASAGAPGSGTPQDSDAPALNFNTTPVVAQGGSSQDVTGIVSVQDAGATLYLNGNRWKAVSLPYNVTANTILQFDFKSNFQGEVQGIGFDSDSTLSPEWFFQVFGTQAWGITSQHDYAGSFGQWKTYTFRVGDYFTGSFNRLVLGNDHDVANPTGESYFRNVKVYEDGSAPVEPTSSVPPPAAPTDVTPFDFRTAALSVYDPAQNLTGGSEVLDGGATLHIAGNTWRKIALPYTVTADTILEFDFYSTSEGEVHGIGFDTDNALSGENFFRVYGTQNWGIGYHDDYTGGGQWRHYRIRVGDFFTGSFQYLMLANDHDVANPTAQSYYANVAVYEETAGAEPVPGSAPAAPAAPGGLSTLNFNNLNVVSYGGSAQDVVSAVTVTDAGRTLYVAGNTWKKIALPYTVTADTILEFDFYSDFQGEVQGLGFDNNDELSPEYFFQVYGTQSWGFGQHNNYVKGDGWKHYRIRVGDFFTGNMTHLTIGMDFDVPIPIGESYFANVAIYQENGSGHAGAIPAPAATGTVLDFSAQTITSYDGVNQDVTGTYDLHDAGRTLHLTGNTWKKISLPTTMTPATVLEFDFRTGSGGEVHGIGFDTDDALSAAGFIQVYGSQNFGITTQKNYAPTGWVHYRIEVGKLLAGSFNYLVFASDHDIANPTAESYYANVRVFEDPNLIPPAGNTPPDAGSTPTLDLDNYAITAFAGQELDGGNGVVQDNGATLHLTGNTWKQIALNYQVTGDTILQFDVKILAEGEVQGIGFDFDNDISDNLLFQIFGSQTWGLQTYRTYAIADGWVRYQIRVGDFYQGAMTKLVIANDHDVANATGEALWANLAIFEDPNPGTSVTPTYNTNTGWGLLDVSRAVAAALGQSGSLPSQTLYGGSDDWGLNAINAPDAWAAGYTGQGIVVAVIDTGVNYNHADLDANIWVNTDEIAGDGIDNDNNGFIDDVRGWDFVQSDNTPMDTNGHGTLVAGIIAAERNGSGATGVAYGAKIMPVRVIDGAGGGDFYSVLDGIEYAVRNGAKVINLSVGFDTGHPDLQNIIQWAQNQGVVVVSAAGNTGASSPIYPAAYANLAGLAVGASSKTNQLASFSNRAGNTVIDYIVAPGVSVLSTNRNGSFSTVSATSFSAPMAAGAAALVLSANPVLPAAVVEQIITQTANPNALTI